MPSKKILIVEDDLDIADLYKLKFEKEWFEVQSVFDWFQATLTVQHFVPDVILLDIMMPDLDGYETLKILKSNSSHRAKIVMFSNLNNPADINKALELWADGYILKASTSPAQAVDKVKEIIG